MADDDNLFGMLCHLLAIFTGFIGPLVLWLIKKDESEFVDQNGKSVLNFTFTVLIAYVGLTILGTVVAIFAPVLSAIFFLLLFLIGIVALVFYIMGTMKAYGGDVYTYPVTIPFLK